MGRMKDLYMEQYQEIDNQDEYLYANQLQEEYQIMHKERLFDAENPEVWELFEKFTNQYIARGNNRGSAEMIINVIRWHTDVQTNDVQFKINNDMKPYYARKYAKHHPDRKDFFSFRKSKHDEEEQL